MNEQSVRRVLSEKKDGFNIEAKGILHDIKYDLDVKTIENVRLINRYDISGITDEEYEKAKSIVFSEPPVDNVYDETVDLKDSCYVLIIESLPGQYDQRADQPLSAYSSLLRRNVRLFAAQRLSLFTVLLP